MDTRAFDASVIVSALPQLLEFLDITLLVGLSSIVLGSLVGAVLAWARLSPIKVLGYAAQLYIYLMRCTPSIVMLFIVFYGLPALIEAVFEENMAVKEACMENPIVKGQYGEATNPIFKVFYLENVHGVIADFSGNPPYKF